MNWRRGLFRLWIVGTVLFVIAVAAISYSDIKAEFDVATSKPVEFRIVPQDEDRVASQQSGGQRVEIKGSAVIVEFPAGTTQAEELRALRARFGPNPWVVAWAKVGLAASIALGIPLVVLVLGVSLVWAFSGFAAKRP